MLARSQPNYHEYRQTLSRMGWSMLFFIPLFNAANILPIILDEIRMHVTSSAGHGVLTAVYGILTAVCYMAPFFLAGLFYYAISRKKRTERVSFEVRLPREFPLLILAGLAILSAGAYVNSWFCTIIGYSVPPEMLQQASYDDPTTVIMYMGVALAPAFAEEFLFRGVFYANLRPYGRMQAILLSSLLFALMHQNISQLFYTFVGGIAMAVMYEKTGSIWCGVFFHMFNNEMAIFSEVLYYGWGGEAARICMTILDGILFLVGVISILLLIRYYRQFPRNAISRYDDPMAASTVVKAALCPGMIVFTAVAVASMWASWLLIAFMNAGGFYG